LPLLTLPAAFDQGATVRLRGAIRCGARLFCFLGPSIADYL